ncbi:helix-turn-helix domain-containing protein [Nocardiopsis exhalans]|uniref:Helix-turn-helix domain-containing protein n=1 Tax=Nocardiopsis exhalans TaxID=163604 RepID=A0ABY5D8F4_9ACTN|nr:helix-turn-helix transcriptional regulator [Nocardiopsis exhalans]USY19599.1 helix-turn-helix domain-containing protein [Nocardiopsis exhalans]
MATGMPVRRRYLVIQLRRLRSAANMTQDEVWKDLGWSRAKIQRLEAGEFQRVKAGDIMALCQLYDAPADVAQELIQIARDSRTHKPWWLQYQDVLPGAFLGLEAEATMIQEFNIGLVPGLLQTEAYVSALLEASVGSTRDQAAQRLKIRLERQETILQRREAPLIFVVIDEAAVRRQIGGPEVMHEQIRHLCEIGQRPNVDVQVLPFDAGAHAAAGLPFTILSFGSDNSADSVVFLESRADGFYLESAEEIDRHRLVFSRTQGSALSVKDSAAFLEGLIS